MQDIMDSEAGKKGIVLLIVSIIGLVVVFGVPWLKFEYSDGYELHEGEADYGDLKDSESDDNSDYLHSSARLSLIGFIFLLLGGIILLVEAVNGSVYRELRRNLPPAIRKNRRNREFLQILFVFIMLGFTLPVIISGARFIGFTRSMVSVFDNYADSSVTFYSLAGWIVFLLGMVLMVAEIGYLSTKLSKILPKYRNKYKQELHNYVLAMTFLCFIGLSLFSLFPVVNDDDSDIQVNDGYVRLMAEAEDKYSDSDDDQKIDSDLNWMKISLFGGFICGAITLLGILYSNYDKRFGSDKFRSLIYFGTLTLVFAFLVIIFNVHLFFHLSDVDGMKFSYNYLPLMCSIFCALAGGPYIKKVLEFTPGCEKPKRKKTRLTEGTLRKWSDPDSGGCEDFGDFDEDGEECMDCRKAKATAAMAKWCVKFSNKPSDEQMEEWQDEDDGCEAFGEEYNPKDPDCRACCKGTPIMWFWCRKFTMKTKEDEDEEVDEKEGKEEGKEKEDE